MDLRANAIITAVDRFSGPVQRMAGSLNALSGRAAAHAGGLQRLNRSFENVGRAANSAFSFAPGMLGGALALHGEYQVDRVTRLMESAGELSAQQRDLLKRTAFSASQLTGIGATEVIEGQRALIQGGLDPAATDKFTETVAKVAKANGIAMDKVAEDAINVANSLGWAMNTSEERLASMTRVMEFMSVVPNLSTESWEGLRTSLRYAAPVAGMLKMEVTELGAALSILADAGFKGEQAGTALRTSLVRIQSATPKARQELRAAGIDLDNLFSFDRSKLNDKDSLTRRLVEGGLGSKRQIDRALRSVDPSKFKSVYAYQDVLMERLSKSLGIKRGDAESRGRLRAAIGQHVEVAKESFDIERYFQGISKLSAPAMKELFGLQRISQAEALRRELNKIMELPTGERITRFRYLVREFNALMPDSIDRRFKAVSQGFAMAMDRASAAFAAARNAVFETQFGQDVTNAIDWFSDKVKSLQGLDPGLLRGIGTGLAAIAAIPVAGFIAIGASGFFSGLASVLAIPALGKLVAAGGLAGLLGAGAAFKAPWIEDTEVPGGQFGTPPILETWDKVREDFVEIFRLAQSIGGATGDLISEVQRLFGFDTSESLFVKGLKLTNQALSDGAHSARVLRENIEAIRNGNFGDLQSPVRKDSYPGLGWIFLKGLGEKMLSPDQSGRTRQFAAPLLKDVTRVEGQATFRLEPIRVEVVGGGRVVSPEQGAIEQQVPLRTGRSLEDGQR